MFEDFAVVDFPPVKGSIPEGRKGFVYVMCWIGGEIEVPFYVGETDRLSGRMNDHRLRSFKATADFRVGECIRYLRERKNCRVIVRYKGSSDSETKRKREEDDIIEELHLSGALLLNHFRGYSYRVDKEIEESERLQKFCEAAIRLHNLKPPTDS